MEEANLSITANPQRLKDRLISLFLLTALGGEGYLLLHDMHKPGESARLRASVTPPVAELVMLRNSVQVQEPDHLVWETAHAGQTLYRRQTVLTGELARAEIAFLDGTGVVLGENSMVEVEKRPFDDTFGYQQISLRLLKGTLHKTGHRQQSQLLRKMASTTPEFDIRVGNSDLRPSPDADLSVTASIDAPNEVQLFVREGEVRVGVSTVRSGEEARVGLTPGADVSARQIPFVPVSPAHDQDVRADMRSLVGFHWNVTETGANGEAMVLEVSANPQFSGDLRKTRIPPSEPPLKFVHTALELPRADVPQRWFWRVRSSDDSVALADTESFWLVPAARPDLDFPLDHATAEIESELSLNWRATDQATSYDVEINGTVVGNTRDTAWKLANADVGTLNWRVRAHLGADESENALSDWSETRELTIVSKAAPPLRGRDL